MIIAADTHLFLYAANPAAPQHESAQRFFAEQASGKERFLLCGLVLVGLYMLLRNPAVFKRPRTAREATAFCDALRANPAWEFGDYEPEVSKALWDWAGRTTTGFRHIIDARLALTLRHHGVTHFATANAKDFMAFGFEKVWNPVA
ncbi:TA system VapC family ribonuclease toxin [Prosthecobacter sp.]|uniref:TA system VapC family ribonuclease toxin n=1 Tax=Prosthecobacter sp. TaxID=1965333 RepID=UPI0037848F17